MNKLHKPFNKISKKAMELADRIDEDEIGTDKAKTILSAYRVAHNAQVALVKFTPKKKK